MTSVGTWIVDNTFRTSTAKTSRAIVVLRPGLDPIRWYRAHHCRYRSSDDADVLKMSEIPPVPQVSRVRRRKRSTSSPLSPHG